MSNMPALRPGGGSRLYPISRLQSPGTISVVRACKVGVARAVYARASGRVSFLLLLCRRPLRPRTRHHALRARLAAKQSGPPE